MQTFLRFHLGIRPFFVTTISLCSVALLATSVLAVIWNLMQVRRADSTPAENASHEYSFGGEDYPMYYPLDIRNVFLVPEDTVHYGITGSDAEEEWKSTFPPGEGFVWLGPERRPFGIALYHQMHCLDLIRRAIDKGHNGHVKGYNGHVHHCFNYLRQAVLCEADDTIEPGVPSLGKNVVRITVQRTCKDWTQVYAAAREAYEVKSKP